MKCCTCNRPVLQNDLASGHSFDTKYYMGDASATKELKVVKEERDLGVIITSDLKSSSQCLKSAATARRMIAMVRRTFRNMDIADFRLIYKVYIRPHLEFCIQAWSPHVLKAVSYTHLTLPTNREV